MGSRPSRQTQLIQRRPVMPSRISNFLPALCVVVSASLSSPAAPTFEMSCADHSVSSLCVSLESTTNAGLWGPRTRPGWGGAGAPGPLCVCSASSGPDPGVLSEPRWLIPPMHVHRSHALVGRYPRCACAYDFWVILASFLQQLK